MRLTNKATDMLIERIKLLKRERKLLAKEVHDSYLKDTDRSRDIYLLAERILSENDSSK